jgi:tetratricopeptide (TPR) repeat protein
MNLASVNGINEIARAYKSKAEKLQNDGDYHGAILFYDKALKLHPKNQELRNSIQACENAIENPVSNLEPSVTNLEKDENILEKAVEEPLSDGNVEEPYKNLLVEGYQLSHWHFYGLTENDYRCNAATISFVDNPTAKRAILDKNFDDINVEVIAKVNHINNVGKYGLIIGYQIKDENNAENYYLFAVHGRENFTLEKISGSQNNQLLSVPFPAEDRDKAETLTLKVKCLGPWIMVYNNHKLLKSWLSPDFVRGKVGLFADPNQQVFFSDFKVSPAISNENELDE